MGGRKSSGSTWAASDRRQESAISERDGTRARLPLSSASYVCFSTRNCSRGSVARLSADRGRARLPIICRLRCLRRLARTFLLLAASFRQRNSLAGGEQEITERHATRLQRRPAYCRRLSDVQHWRTKV